MSDTTETPEPGGEESDLSDLGRNMMGSTGGHPQSGSCTGARSGDKWIPPTAEELATMLPGYEIVKMLGRGGMGAVYMGRQVNLDRAVAIKILSNALEEADAGFVERFQNEARAMAKLEHPGIVAVHDFGETDNGLLYIVMQYVDGTDVARMIAADGRLHTEHAMAITAHVCDALGYAHDRGIIHRDIKPANIMVGYDGVVKVADFGLAKAHGGDGESIGLTQSGVVMGTMHYMAPEMMVLGSRDVDQRVDVYAVGVMLYHMLVGKLSQGIFELPSMQVPGLDPRYDGIISRAMRENPDQRYQSVGELRSDLDSIMTQPVVHVEAPEEGMVEAEVPALPTVARPQRPGGRKAPAGGSRPIHRRPAPASSSSRLPGWVWPVAAFGILAVGGAGLFLSDRRGEDAPTGDDSTGLVQQEEPIEAPPVHGGSGKGEAIDAPQESVDSSVRERLPEKGEPVADRVEMAKSPEPSAPKPAEDSKPVQAKGGGEKSENRTSGPAAAPGEWVDQLPLVDIDSVTFGQGVRLESGEVVLQPTAGQQRRSLVPISNSANSNYELEFSFTITSRNAWGQVAVSFPAGEEGQATWLLNKRFMDDPDEKQHFGAIEAIGGRNASEEENPTKYFPSSIERGQRHRAKLQVLSLPGNEVAIELWIDGQSRTSWKGPARDLELTKEDWAGSDRDRIWIGRYGNQCEFTLHEVRFRTLEDSVSPSLTLDPGAPGKSITSLLAGEWWQRVENAGDSAYRVRMSPEGQCTLDTTSAVLGGRWRTDAEAVSVAWDNGVTCRFPLDQARGYPSILTGTLVRANAAPVTVQLARDASIALATTTVAREETRRAPSIPPRGAAFSLIPLCPDSRQGALARGEEEGRGNGRTPRHDYHGRGGGVDQQEFCLATPGRGSLLHRRIPGEPRSSLAVGDGRVLGFHLLETRFSRQCRQERGKGRATVRCLLFQSQGQQRGPVERSFRIGQKMAGGIPRGMGRGGDPHATREFSCPLRRRVT